MYFVVNRIAVKHTHTEFGARPRPWTRAEQSTERAHNRSTLNKATGEWGRKKSGCSTLFVKGNTSFFHLFHLFFLPLAHHQVLDPKSHRKFRASSPKYHTVPRLRSVTAASEHSLGTLSAVSRLGGRIHRSGWPPERAAAGGRRASSR